MAGFKSGENPKAAFSLLSITEVIPFAQYSQSRPESPSTEVNMLDTRRYFLRNLAGVSCSFLLLQTQPPIPTPRRRTPVDPPEPAEKQDPEKLADNTKSAQRAQLQAQEKEFRETMDLLFTKVRDLKLQLDRIHTSEIFSLAVFKQTQEIEKLAKQLKNHAKA
jgi:hypothetical protein